MQPRVFARRVVPMAAIAAVVAAGWLVAAATRPLDVELRTEIEIYEKTEEGWKAVDRVGPETVRFSASLLDLADGGTIESAYVFRATSADGVPYAARLAGPAKVRGNPVSGRFDAELTFEVSYGDDTARVPASLTTADVRSPAGVRRGRSMRGALGGGETTMTLVSANRMERREGPPLLLVCTERYRMVPSAAEDPARPAAGR